VENTGGVAGADDVGRNAGGYPDEMTGRDRRSVGGMRGYVLGERRKGIGEAACPPQTRAGASREANPAPQPLIGQEAADEAAAGGAAEDGPEAAAKAKAAVGAMSPIPIILTGTRQGSRFSR